MIRARIFVIRATRFLWSFDIRQLFPAFNSSFNSLGTFFLRKAYCFVCLSLRVGFCFLSSSASSPTTRGSCSLLEELSDAGFLPFSFFLAKAADTFFVEAGFFTSSFLPRRSQGEPLHTIRRSVALDESLMDSEEEVQLFVAWPS